MLKTNCFLVFMFLSLSAGILAQKTIVSGKIIDAETSEVMPFTNISFQHSPVGTISDIDGTFFISTLQATDTLLVSSLGYEMERIYIKKGAQQQIEVSLHPTRMSIEEVVVRPGENPAHLILDKIYDRKKYNNPDRFESYQYKSYNKLRLDMNNIDQGFKDQRLMRDFSFVFDYMDSSEVFGKNYLPMLISETVSNYYFQKNPAIKTEVIVANKVSGIENKTVSQFTGKMYSQLNIYDNFMTFFDPGFISPIADFGKFYYKYYLEDSTFIDNSWCYRISFKPKRKQERTFYGYFWVADTSFAIKKIQLRVSSDVNLNFLKDMVAVNEYSKINDSVWFLKSEDYLIDFNIAEKTYGFFGRKNSVYDSIIVNQPIPESVSKLKTETYVDEKNLRKSNEYWAENRKTLLSVEDTNIYRMVDSVQKVPMYKTIYGLADMVFNYYIVKGLFEYGPYYTFYSFNPIEGSRFRFGGRTSNAFSTKLMLGGHVAYGMRDERTKYGIYANYMFSTNPRITAGVAYFDDIRQLGKSENSYLDDNILASLLRTSPNYQLTMVTQYNANFEREWVHGISNTIAIQHQTIFPTQYVPFNEFQSNGDTVAINHLTSAEITLSTHFCYHEKFVWGKFTRVSLGSKYPALDLDLTYGPKGVFNSDYEYFKMRLKISDKLETNPIGYLRYIVTLGKTYGTLPYPLLELHEGNETYAFDPYAFNMMNFYEFVSDRYISVYAEHHFQGLLFNRIPLIRYLEWREVIGGKALIGRLDEANTNVLQFPEGLSNLTEPYYEAGVGIENIFKFIRVDAMWRFSYLDNQNVQPFSIRVKLQVNF